MAVRNYYIFVWVSMSIAVTIETFCAVFSHTRTCVCTVFFLLSNWKHLKRMQWNYDTHMNFIWFAILDIQVYIIRREKLLYSIRDEWKKVNDGKENLKKAIQIGDWWWWYFLIGSKLSQFCIHFDHFNHFRSIFKIFFSVASYSFFNHLKFHFIQLNDHFIVDHFHVAVAVGKRFLNHRAFFNINDSIVPNLCVVSIVSKEHCFQPIQSHLIFNSFSVRCSRNGFNRRSKFCCHFFRIWRSYKRSIVSSTCIYVYICTHNAGAHKHKRLPSRNIINVYNLIESHIVVGTAVCKISEAAPTAAVVVKHFSFCKIQIVPFAPINITIC